MHRQSNTNVYKRTMETNILLCLLLLSAFCGREIIVVGSECGTRFTDFSSSVVLAEVVLQGSVLEFNPSLYSRNIRTANVNVSDVFKGMEILKSTGRMNDRRVVVESFGQENRDDCIAPEDEKFKHQDMVFFLRQSPESQLMLEHSAMPLPAEGDEKLRIRRSLCDTCIQPPSIRRLVCKDCAKKPIIRTMKSKKTTMGRKAKLRCNVRGKPAPTIAWFKDDIPIVSGIGGMSVRTTGFVSTLHFMRTTSAHSGRYKCVASNGIGSTEEYVTLEVSTTPRRKSQDTTDYSVKDAPDKVQCQANPCENGGMCFFSVSLNLRQCVCPSGFEGVRCENVQALNTILNETDPLRTTHTTTATRSSNTTITTTTTTITNRNNKIKDNHIDSGININNNISSNNNTNNVDDDNNTTNSTLHESKSSQNSNASETEKTTTKCGISGLCFNGGTCLYNALSNVRYCRCQTGYYGSRCERWHSIIPDASNRQNVTQNRTASFHSSLEAQSNPNMEKAAVQNTPDTHATSKQKTGHGTKENNSSSFPATSMGITSPTNINQPRKPKIFPVRNTDSIIHESTFSRPSSRYSSNGQRLPGYPVRKKSSLKIITCRDKMYCLNKGKCKYISKLSKKFCQCRTGYGGVRCERKLF